MFCITCAFPYKIITVYDICDVVTSVFTTAFIEIAGNIVGYIISVKKAETLLTIWGVGYSMNRLLRMVVGHCSISPRKDSRACRRNISEIVKK